MEKSDILEQMRVDWDARALENAKFYINCRRRDQDDAEFDGSALDILARVRRDYAFLPFAESKERRFLEIGCGIGRLMRPLSEDCGEIHGVDVSAEMVRAGKEWLAAIPHAHLHVALGARLPQFADNSFDLVYSWAVFQHIPDRDLIYSYLTDAFRVLKPGGVIVGHFNGAPPAENRCDTWIGAWTSEEQLLSYASKQGWQVLSTEGGDTPYLWLTMRKPDRRRGPHAGPPPLATITAVVPPSGSSDIVAGGPAGFALVFLRDLPIWSCSITELSMSVGTRPVYIRYIGADLPGGLRQINIQIPECIPPGSQHLTLWRKHELASNSFPISVRACPRPEPRLLSITDGVEIPLGNLIRSRIIKVNLSGCSAIETFKATISGRLLEKIGTFCEDPLLKSYKMNVQLPSGLTGRHVVHVSVDEMDLGFREIEIPPAEQSAGQ